MRLDLSRKVEGEWCSFNELCGVGDGIKKEFKMPFPAAEARSVLVLRDFQMIMPDGRLVEKNEKDGTILKDEPDGYKLETRDTEVWIVFDQAPAFGVRVSVSCLGRKTADAFCILPMSTKLQKAIQEKLPASLKGRDQNKITLLDLQEGGKINFQYLVTDWTVTGADDKVLTCDTDMKAAFLERMDAIFFGGFAANRAGAIRSERMNALEKDSTDS